MSAEGSASGAAAGSQAQQRRLSWLHSRLERRLVAVLIALVVGALASLALVDYRMTRHTVLQELSRRSEQAVTRLEHSLANPLWSYNEQAASAYLRGEMQDENLVAIVVTDLEENEVWLAYARRHGNDTPQRVEGGRALNTEIVNAYGSHSGLITYDGVNVGEVTVFFRDDAAQAEIRNRLAATGAVTAVLGLTVAIVTAVLLHRMVVVPLQALLLRLDRVAVGDYMVAGLPHRDDDIGVINAGFERMVSTIAEREASLRASAEEKEVMLREIHHRVKNNFQILSSLLNLQKRGVHEEAMRALEDSEHRVRSMEMVHEKLYESPSLAHIRTAGYVRELVELLRVSYGVDASRINVEAEDMDIPLDTAVPLGLIIHETVSNACKYACGYSNSTHVYVGFQVDEQVATLVVSDNGPGLPDASEGTADERLGLQLVGALASQLDGTVEIRSESGVHLTITFPFDVEM